MAVYQKNMKSSYIPINSGFSVSRGHRLQDGAFDNTLAASLAGDEHYQMKYGTNHFRVTEQAVFFGLYAYARS